MKTKNKVGVLVILGGVALIGIYWFRKNKPTIAQSQAKGLEALSNFYKTGGTDDEYIKGYKAPTTSQISIGSFISGQESKAIAESANLAVNCSIPFLAEQNGIDCTEYCKTNPKNCPSYTNQIAKNLQDVDFSDLSRLGLAGIDFSNFDFTKLANLNLSNIKK
jgi:hypothetical protein